jgi:hypothetical protein
LDQVLLESEVRKDMNSPVMQPEQLLGALPPLKLFIGGKWVDSDEVLPKIRTTH